MTTREKLTLAIFFLLTLVATGIAVVPPWRESARRFLIKDTRQVLASARADLKGNGRQLSVLKVQTRDALIVEIYDSTDASGDLKLIKSITLPDRRDGYFTFKGEATNLVVTDIDDDGTLEIIAPTFDTQLVARLNIFHYDKQTQDFERVSSSAFN
jgi:hypothetical protein